MAAGGSRSISDAGGAGRHGSSAHSTEDGLVANSVFAQRIEAARLRRGLSKTELIAGAAIGRASLYKLLRAGSKWDPLPSVETLLRLATALMVHPFWLLEGLLSQHATYGQREAMQGFRMGFVHDASFCDGALVAPGQRFLKKALVQNLSPFTVPGHTIHLKLLGPEIQVRCPHRDSVHKDWLALEPEAPPVLKEDLAPGETTVIEIWFQAPTRPGPALAVFLVANEQGQMLFNQESLVWVWVQVSPWAQATDCVVTGEPILLPRSDRTTSITFEEAPKSATAGIDEAPGSPLHPVALDGLSLSRGLRQSLKEVAKEFDTLMRRTGSLTKLAKVAEVSRGTVYRLLDLPGTGWRMPRMNKLIGLARALKLHPSSVCEVLFHGVCVPFELDASATGLRPELRTSDRIQGAMVSPGDPFLHRWTVRNPLPVRAPEGSLQLVCLDPEFELRSANGGLMHACQVPRPAERLRVIQKALEPGASVEVEMMFSAPRTNGTVFSVWALQDRQGEIVGPTPQLYWTVVRVTELADNVAFRRK